MKDEPSTGRAVGVYCEPGHQYSRLYLKADRSAYQGMCYKCGTRLRVRAGAEGWDTRNLAITCPRAVSPR